MSEQKRISPLLDGFTLGNPMSEHDGVRCCPAIKENTDKKYIVKIITVPATQAQLDALLLAGAYKDPADAMEYYKGVGEEIMKEAELLQTLSKAEGFLAYDAWQMEPITRRRLGYEVYLISSYKRSLDKYVRRNPVSHLEAVNLGLDLCSALAACRQAGAMYVDLKPSNIFISDKKEYRIGDLGFIDLKALSYSTLPDKYRSVYTPPEAFDPMAPLNLTIDTYAVGMILYQLYNEGQLPSSEHTPEDILPTPVNADYELAEIITKAIHPDPAQRWTDPVEMGKALASYMQRNTVNDTPITPYAPLEAEQTKPERVEIQSVTVTEAQETDTPSDESDTDPTLLQQTEPSAEETETENTSAEAMDDTAPTEEDAQTLLPHEMSEDLSQIMSKADDLIAHETPEGVIIPQAPELPDPFAFIEEDSEDLDDFTIPLDPIMETEEEIQPDRIRTRKFASKKGKRILQKILSYVLVLLILFCLGLCAYVYYHFIYLKTINGIHIDGDKTHLTVAVDTEMDTSKLTVTCSDHYGNSKTRQLTDGKAVFSELLPNTMYTIQLQIDGFHKLVGQTSDIFTTDATTNIVSFHAVAGTTDGTVILSFTVDGEEPKEWTIRYGTDGESEQHKTFTGHTVTLDNLTVGKLYTFTLDAGSKLSLSGSCSLDYLVTRLILAENLTVTSNGNSDMTVHWKSPGDIVVDSWDVRCYSDSGYDEQLTVQDTSVYLTGIDPAVSYTVEVTAAGMIQPARTSITANPINITALNVDAENENSLTVNWEYDGADPENGWLLMYSMDGGITQSVVKCKTASAVITPKIPDAKYLFTIQAADGTSIFSNVHTYTCPTAEQFNAYSLSAENIEGMLVKTPEDAYWHFGKLESGAVTDQFALGDRISAVLHGTTDFYLPGAEQINILYVIRDAYGNVLPDMVSEEIGYWKEIWNTGDYHYAELDLPNVPTNTGEYTLNIYFNGFAITELTFHIN